MTMAAFENAIRVDMALGGSTNSILHLTAIAHEAGIELPLSKFDEISRLGILLNRTREEIARDHVTRAEMNLTVDKLGERFDSAFKRLEDKLDEFRKG